MKQLDKSFFIQKIKELAEKYNVRLDEFNLAVQYMLDECDAYMFVKDFDNVMYSAIAAKQLPETGYDALNDILELIYEEDNSPLLYVIQAKRYDALVDATGEIVNEIHSHEEN